MSRSLTPKTIFTLLAGILVVSAGIAVAISADRDKAGSICFEEPSWTNPGFGTQVDHYVAEVRVVDTGEIRKFSDIPFSEPNSSFRYESECGETHQMRVAGVDASGRQGPWSDWSLKRIVDQESPGFQD